jgi:glucokinase
MRSDAGTRNALGIDIGGTSVRAAIVSSDGTVQGELYDAPHYGGDITSELARICLDLRQQGRQHGIGYDVVGVALAGGWDPRTGRVSSAPTAPSLLGRDPRTFDVGGPVVVIANDADAALFAEWRCGAARGSRNCLGFIVGTGLGGSAIVDCAPLRGSNGVAGEFGHLVFEPQGRACGCGGTGCLEQYVSGTALMRDYVGRIARADVATAHEVAVLARSGDAAAADAFMALGHRLGSAVASLTNVFNPDTVVLGGGMIDVSDLFLPAVRSAVAAHTMPMAAAAMTLKLASLGRAAGVVGAAIMAGAKR